MADFANIPRIYFCHSFQFDLFAACVVSPSPTDKLWPINIKKGLISVLELKINGRFTIASHESYLSESGKPPSKTKEILVLKSTGDFGQGRQEGQE